QTQHDAARRTLALTRARDNRRALVRDLDELRHKGEALAATLAQAEAEQARQLALQAEVAALEIRAGDLNALRDQARQLRELDIRRTAIATRLRFAL
ncbi:hypothetical protein, partial [Proteus mirabilis]